MWQPSPSPEESWSDASGGNEDGEWPVIGVVGEELRLDGTSRYEVRWGNWHRQDGSNTTWETDNFERVDLLKRWRRAQKRMRNTLADISFDMKVPWPDDAVHKRITEHRKQAYDEKLERRRCAGPISTANWDAEIDATYRRLQEPERGEANSRLRVRRVNAASVAGSSAGVPSHAAPAQWSRTSSPALVTSSRDQTISSTPTARWPRITSTPTSLTRPTSSTTFSHKGLKALIAGSSRDSEIARETLPSVTISQPTLRGRISSTWNKAAKEGMAATVRISSDISDEEIPSNLKKFKYIEQGYVFCDDQLQEVFEVSRDVFMVCSCITCVDASDCSCQDLSESHYPYNRKVFAYSEGLFTFDVPRGVEVIECNKYCECNYDCGNRVAQHPRNVRIEIFDTKRCGWGVRALNDIPQGNVLGTYAGMLVRREGVEELPEEHHGYLFDLDGTEVRNSENLGGRYTVDSYEYGNWTRFVNHSCSPNMEVYSVVYDTIPDVNMPYVAFAASSDIAAGTELTIDYAPHAEENKKGKRSANGGNCRCGSRECRGWIKL